jgi:DNA-binding response OmpR family regulator
VNVALHPEQCSEGVVDGLALAGATVVPTPELVPEDRRINDADLLCVELADQPLRRLRELSRIVDAIGLPILVVASVEQLAMLESGTGITDFILSPVDALEMKHRLQRLFADDHDDQLITFKDLELNPLNYQATLAGDPLDMTFMEYELLRFLVENPVRVWSREQLLSKVWGYDYYGGARTVDVHVRRLRAKLGEERSSWITTVRSVGYRFG